LPADWLQIQPSALPPQPGRAELHLNTRVAARRQRLVQRLLQLVAAGWSERYLLQVPAQQVAGALRGQPGEGRHREAISGYRAPCIAGGEIVQELRRLRQVTRSTPKGVAQAWEAIEQLRQNARAQEAAIDGQVAVALILDPGQSTSSA
jgi:hypothetical protein